MKTKSIKELREQFNRTIDYAFKHRQEARHYLICLIFDEYEPKMWDAARAIAKRDNLTYKKMLRVQVPKNIYATPIQLTQIERERLHVLASNK